MPPSTNNEVPEPYRGSSDVVAFTDALEGNALHETLESPLRLPRLPIDERTGNNGSDAVHSGIRGADLLIDTLHRQRHASLGGRAPVRS